MKEPKKTPVPLPGPRAKPKVKDTPLKGPLSQEFIESDDDSSTENTHVPKAAEKPKTTGAINKPTVVVKSKSKLPAKEPATPKPAQKSKASPKKPALKQVLTKEQAVELSDSGQTDDSDAPARNVQTRLAGNEKRTDSSSESDSGSSSGSDSDESDANRAPQPRRNSAQEQARQSNSQSHAVEFRPVQPYVPPRGFNPVPINDKTTSKAGSMFVNLDGKQVWHITAPAGVSLKDLKELAMDKALDGQAVLNCKGTNYGFSQMERSEDGAREVLVPQKDGFKALSARISQTLHLQAVVRLPELSSQQADPNTGSAAAASITRSTIRAPRPQVKGLKMRFLPTGFGGNATGTLGDSDSEMEAPQETAGLGMPNGLNLASRKEKRKHSDVNGGEMAESSKKSKKHRTAEDVRRKEERRARKEKKRAQESALAKS